MDKYYDGMKQKFEIEEAFKSSESEEETKEALQVLRPENNLRVRNFMNIEKARSISKYERTPKGVGQSFIQTNHN